MERYKNEKSVIPFDKHEFPSFPFVSFSVNFVAHFIVSH